MSRPGEENLIPFKPGHDPRRGISTGRPPILNTEEKINEFAELVSNGLTNQELADHFSMSKWSASHYKKDPRVKVASLKYVEDRVLEITRRTDTTIAKRLLEESDELDTLTLLKIRREFLGGALRAQTTGDAKDPNTINEAMEQLEANPELAEALEKILATKA